MAGPAISLHDLLGAEIFKAYREASAPYFKKDNPTAPDALAINNLGTIRTAAWERLQNLAASDSAAVAAIAEFRKLSDPVFAKATAYLEARTKIPVDQAAIDKLRGEYEAAAQDPKVNPTGLLQAIVSNPALKDKILPLVSTAYIEANKGLTASGEKVTGGTYGYTGAALGEDLKARPASLSITIDADKTEFRITTGPDGKPKTEVKVGGTGDWTPATPTILADPKYKDIIAAAEKAAQEKLAAVAAATTQQLAKDVAEARARSLAAMALTATINKDGPAKGWSIKASNFTSEDGKTIKGGDIEFTSSDPAFAGHTVKMVNGQPQFFGPNGQPLAAGSAFETAYKAAAPTLATATTALAAATAAFQIKADHFKLGSTTLEDADKKAITAQLTAYLTKVKEAIAAGVDPSTIKLNAAIFGTASSYGSATEEKNRAIAAGRGDATLTFAQQEAARIAQTLGIPPTVAQFSRGADVIGTTAQAAGSGLIGEFTDAKTFNTPPRSTLRAGAPGTTATAPVPGVAAPVPGVAAPVPGATAPRPGAIPPPK